jgi:hypothetical protein
MNTFMLVMTIMSSSGQHVDIALAFDLSWHDCGEMAYYMDQGLNENAEVFCELEGVYADE